MWILLRDQPELEARLVPCAGITSIPIVIKVSAFGADIELPVYTNTTVKSLLERVAEFSGLNAHRLKLKVIEET